MSSLARLDNLTKRYGDIAAVNGVGFSLEPGEVLGLLGPNGAGKTTTLRLLTGVLRPSAGHVEVLGSDPAGDPGVRRHLGYLPAELRLPPDATGRQLMSLHARLRECSEPAGEELATRLDLDLDRPAGTLSTWFSGVPPACSPCPSASATNASPTSRVGRRHMPTRPHGGASTAAPRSRDDHATSTTTAIGRQARISVVPARPTDDGLADHLPGATVPHVHLPSTRGGHLSPARLASERLVAYVFPGMGPPGAPDPLGWMQTPGAHGCTEQSCSFRDWHDVFKDAGYAIVGVSAQSARVQREASERVAEKGRISRIFYPVFPPWDNPQQVFDWITAGE